MVRPPPAIRFINHHYNLMSPLPRLSHPAGRVTAAKKDGGGKLPEIKIFTESEFEEFLDQTLPADQRKAAREPLPPIAGAAPATSSSSRPAGVGAGASSSSAVASSSSGGGRGDNHLGRAASSLWVDKYAPKHFSEYLVSGATD